MSMLLLEECIESGQEHPDCPWGASLDAANLRWLRSAGSSGWLCLPNPQGELEEPQPSSGSAHAPLACQKPPQPQPGLHTGISCGVQPVCALSALHWVCSEINPDKLRVLANSAIYLSVSAFTPSSSSKGLTWVGCTHIPFYGRWVGVLH